MGKTIQQMRAVVGLFMALLALSAGHVFADKPPVDPIEWTQPSSRPEFRELIKGREFQDRMRQAGQELGTLDDLENLSQPIRGVKILRVVPDGPAELLGIRVGDIITHCNGDLLWTSSQLSPAPEGERKIQLMSSGGDVRTLELPPGKIGVDLQEIWHPELEYLRSDNRNPRWDNDVVIALAKRTSDPELAETCWARAVAAGYPRDARSAMSGALIAMHSGRVETAADFGFFCLNQDREGNETVHPHELYRIAIANFKLKHALQLIEQDPTLVEPEDASILKDLISLHEERSREERCQPSPSQLAEQMYRDDIRSRILPLNDHPSVKNHVEHLRSSPQGRLTAATSNFALAIFSPPLPAKNVDLQVRFRMKATDREESEFIKVFECGLADVEFWNNPERSRRGSETLLFAGFQNTGVVGTAAAGLSVSQFDDDLAAQRPEAVYSVRLVRVEGQGEVFVNGTRALYTPLYDDVDFVSIMLKSVGLDVEILDLEVVELIERL